MPQINRIRVNNIKYNFGTQFYDDFVMRFSCRNSLYDLANGGGKSVLMLLLMQNLIPNCTLDDKQPIEKLFRSGNDNTVIHSLIEWKLDACDMRDGFKYMTTGFCARKGRDNGDEARRDGGSANIEYFNYCIFYKGFGENDIKNLPLVANGERVTYGGLKTYLRNLEKSDSGLEIRIFDRKGDYQKYISDYGLYESQWEIVRGINRTEGHVRTYFENSYKTTRKVIEDLLIEEIIEKSYNNRIRGGESDDEEMAQTLLDIKDKLIELSRRKDEVHGYDRQIELLTEFGAGLDGLRTLYADKQRAENALVQCLAACRAKLAGTKKRARELEEQDEGLNADYMETLRLATAAELETELVELDKLDALYVDTLAQRDAVLENKKQLVSALALKEAAADYADYIEYRRKYDEVRELLNSRDIGQDELVAELARLAATKRRYVEQERTKLEARERMARETADNDKVQLEADRIREQELLARINSCKGIEGELSAERARLDGALDSMMQGMGILTSDSVDTLIEDNNAHIEEIQSSIEDIKKAIERNFSGITELGIKRAKLEASAAGSAEELHKQEEQLSAAIDAEEKLGKIMEIYGAADGARLATTVEYIYNGLVAERIAAGKELDGLKAYRDSIEKHRLPEYETGYDAVLTYLKGRYGDDVVSGREFVESMSDEDASDALRSFPQLPYVILAGESYENVSADKVISSMNTGSYMIPILPMGSWQDGIKYVSAYKDMSFLWDAAALAAELDKTSEDIARLEENYKKLEDKCEVVQNDLAEVRYLVHGENSGAIKERIFNIKNQISVYNEQIEAVSGQIETCENSADTQREALRTAMEQLELLKEERHRYSGIRNLTGDARTLAAKLAENIRVRKESEKELAEVKSQLNSCRDRLAENRSAAEDARAKIEALERDFADNFKQYMTDGAMPYDNMTHEQADARAGALRSLIGESQGDVADKQKLLAVYENSMRKCEQNMRYAGMTLDEAAKLYSEGRLVQSSVEEMIELKVRIADAEKKAAAFDETLEAQSAQKNRIVGSCEHGRRRYEEQFGEFTRVNTENPQAAVLKYRRDMSAIKERQLSVSNQIKELENSSRDELVMEKDLERIIRNAGLEVPELPDDNTPLEPSELNAGDYEQIQRDYERIVSEENKLKNKFYRDKQILVEELDKCHAYELAREIRTSVELPLNAADIDVTVKGISETNDCIALERDRIEKTMQDMERIKDSFEERCVQICANIRTELDRLPKLSRITLEDEVIPIVTLSVPYIKENMYKERMSVYINETVSGAETFAAQEDKLKYIRGRLSWKKLFSVIVNDMNSIKLCLYKREHIKDQSRYLRYEEAVGSTGQSQGIYIQFLIAVINYISSINSAGKDTSVTGKTIFIDNPFGAAKDVYIWEPIFKMLATNHVQLIVPARGVTPAITKMFDVNYILGQQSASGRQQTVVVDYRSQVQAEEMDYVQLEFEQAAFDFL